MNRDFTYKGIEFHLNDNWNSPLSEYEGKYNLLFYHKGYERWQQCTTVDSKKEAMEYAKKNYLFL